MREPLGETSRRSCSRAAALLEKRIAEETLSDQQHRDLDEHLRSCPRCRELSDLISALPQYADELSDGEVRSAYRAVVSKRSLRRQTGERGILTAAIVAAVAAAVAIVVDNGWLQSPRIEEGDAESGSLECPVAHPATPAPGVLMTYCEGQKPDVTVDNAGEVNVLLKKGAVGLLVDPNRPGRRKVAVETHEGVVRVKGTIFTVQIDGDNTRVEVFRGGVEFVPSMSPEDTLYVTTGQWADLRHRRTSRLSSPKTEVLLRALESWKKPEYASKNETSLERGHTENALNATPDTTEADETYGSNASKTAQPSGEQPKPTKKKSRFASRATPKPAAPTIDALIQDAQSCMIAREWTCASSRYHDLLERYPGRPEATAALISLARIELRRLNKPTSALDHYRAYQQQAPNGPMAEEALFGIAETYRRLGKTTMEETTLRTFLTRYPRSPQTNRVKARLRRLEND